MTDPAEDDWPSALFLHGLDLLDENRVADALPVLESALADCADHPEVERAAICLRWIGATHARLAGIAAGVEYLVQAMDLLEDEPLTEVTVECARLAGVWLSLGRRYDEAVPYLRLAREGFRLIAEHDYEDFERDAVVEAAAEVDDALGDAMYAAERYAEALPLYRSAAAAFESLGDLESETFARHDCAATLMALDDAEGARTEFTALCALLEKQDQHGDLADCVYLVGVTSHALGDTAKAETDYLRARAMYDPSEQEVAIANCDNSLGELYQELERVPEAISRTVAARTVFEKHDMEDDRVGCQARLIDLYPKLADLQIEAAQIDVAADTAAVLREIVTAEDFTERVLAEDLPQYLTDLPIAVAHVETALGAACLGVGRYAEAAEALTRLRDLRRETADRLAELDAEVLLAMVWLHQGRVDAAETAVARARDEFALASDAPRYWRALRIMAVIASTRLDYAAAMTMLDSAIRWASENGDDEFLAECRGDRAQVLIDTADFAAGIDEATEAGAKFEEFGEWLHAAASQVRVATAEYYLGNYARAARLLDAACAMFERSGAHRLHLSAKVVKGLLLSDTGRYGDAEQVLREARALARRSGLETDQATILHGLGAVRFHKGDLAAAADAFAIAERIYRRAGLERLAMGAMQNRAVVILSQGDPVQAHGLTESARRYYESNPAMRWNLAMTYRNLAHLCSRLGNHASAAAHIRSARAIAAEFGLTAEVARCDFGAAELRRVGNGADLYAMLDLAVPAVLFLDAQRLQFPHAADRVAWRSGTLGEYLATMFEWAHRYGNGALMADLVEMTVNSGTHVAAAASEAADPRLAILDTVPLEDIETSARTPGPPTAAEPIRIGGAATLIAGAKLPMRPPPRLVNPTGHVVLGRFLDSADQRYGVVQRPAPVRTW
ncbi:tetratricopeptide repeat protein [Nocardia takedensis]